LHLRLIDGAVKVTMAQDRIERLRDKLDREIEDRLDPEKILRGLYQVAHDSYQFYRRAGADCSVIDRYLAIQFWDRLRREDGNQNERSPSPSKPVWPPERHQQPQLPLSRLSSQPIPA